jgi:hypothetical protein
LFYISLVDDETVDRLRVSFFFVTSGIAIPGLRVNRGTRFLRQEIPTVNKKRAALHALHAVPRARSPHAPRCAADNDQ